MISSMESDQFNRIVDAIVRELTLYLADRGIQESNGNTTHRNTIQEEKVLRDAFNHDIMVKPIPLSDVPNSSHSPLLIDLPDPTVEDFRARPGIQNPLDSDGLRALMGVTPARIGYGRSGPRYQTPYWLLFQADQAITQDTLFRDVNPHLLEELGLKIVQTQITEGKQQYLLRPDLGRKLCEEARQFIQ